MSDTGVVDPIRVQVSVGVFLRRLPRLAQVFITLAILDIIGRWLGAIEPGLYLTTDYPPSFVAAFLPHDALIALPALVVLRRPDAEAATPWVFRGAVIVALVELLWTPTRSLLSGIISAEDAGLLGWLSVVGFGLTALGWVVLGNGLSALNPRTPPAWVGGIANMAALLILVTIVVGLISIAIARPNVADPAGSGTSGLSFVAGSVGLLAWAYLIRSVLRGFDDPSRSLTVTRLGAVGALLSATMTFLGSILGLIFTISTAIAIRIGNELGQGIYLAGDTIGVTLIVAAIALGFADPLRPMPKDWAKAAAA